MSPHLQALLGHEFSPEQIIKCCRRAVALDLWSDKKTFRLHDDAKVSLDDEMKSSSCGFDDALSLILGSYPRVDDGDHR